jgi:hypothetical protein
MSTATSPTQTSSRGRQFSLRTLMVVVTLCCVGLVIWNVSIEPYRRQHQFIAKVEKLKGIVHAEAADSVWRRFAPEATIRNRLVTCNLWRVPLGSALELVFDEAWRAR